MQFNIPRLEQSVVEFLFNKFDTDCAKMIYRHDFRPFYKLCLCWIRDAFFPESIRFRRDLFILSHNQSNVQLLDVYEKDAKLGQGQFGVVHRVRERRTGALRCCKTISKTRQHSGVPAEFVQTEISILRQLDHPNVVKLYETFEDASSIYLIFELIEGEELLKLLLRRGKEGKAMTEREAARILKPALSSIAHCHARRIMHKDLKPENIMVVGGEEGVKTGDVKVIDFGLSEIFVPGSASTQAAGTPYYMAPEVFHCKFNYKCDVWSVGVLMYLLLTAHLPFDAPDKEKYIKVVNSNAVSFPRKLFEHISKDAVYLIKRMLTKDPAQRPTASQVLSDPWFSKFYDDDDRVAMVNIEKEYARSVASPSNGPMSPPASPSRTACASPCPIDNKFSLDGCPVTPHRLEGVQGLDCHFRPLSNQSPLASAPQSPNIRTAANPLQSGSVSPSHNSQLDSAPASPLRYLTKQGSKFLRFSKQTPFARICLNLVSMSLPFDAILNAPVVFRALDNDHDGLLSETELAEALLQLGVPDDEIPQMIDSMDVDDSGEISYSEFVAALIDTTSPEFERSLYSVFRRFDLNNDGFITKEELGQLLAVGGLAMDASRTNGGSPVDRIMTEIDPQGKGSVSFNAFAQFLHKAQASAEVASRSHLQQRHSSSPIQQQQTQNFMFGNTVTNVNNIDGSESPARVFMNFARKEILPSAIASVSAHHREQQHQQQMLQHQQQQGNNNTFQTPPRHSSANNNNTMIQQPSQQTSIVVNNSPFNSPGRIDVAAQPPQLMRSPVRTSVAPSASPPRPSTTAGLAPSFSNTVVQQHGSQNTNGGLNSTPIGHGAMRVPALQIPVTHQYHQHSQQQSIASSPSSPHIHPQHDYTQFKGQPQQQVYASRDNTSPISPPRRPISATQGLKGVGFMGGNTTQYSNNNKSPNSGRVANAVTPGSPSSELHTNGIMTPMLPHAGMTGHPGYGNDK